MHETSFSSQRENRKPSSYYGPGWLSHKRRASESAAFGSSAGEGTIWKASERHDRTSPAWSGRDSPSARRWRNSLVFLFLLKAEFRILVCGRWARSGASQATGSAAEPVSDGGHWRGMRRVQTRFRRDVQWKGRSGNPQSQIRGRKAFNLQKQLWRRMDAQKAEGWHVLRQMSARGASDSLSLCGPALQFDSATGRIAELVNFALERSRRMPRLSVRAGQCRCAPGKKRHARPHLGITNQSSL
jgi:hypothetical protein